MTTELQDHEWDQLLSNIHNNQVIPVVGPGVVTFGKNNELLYPWLVKQMPSLLDPQLNFEQSPCSLQDIADKQQIEGQLMEVFYACLSRITLHSDLRPGSTLSDLVSIEGFKFFISTTFDPLLPRAVESNLSGGKIEECRGALSLRNECPDLPHEILSALEHRFVYQIFGRAESTLDFAALDDDTFLFLLRLDQELSNQSLKNLNAAFRKYHFLILGVSYTNCLLRFLAHIKFKRNDQSEFANKLLNVFECIDLEERDNVIAYIEKKGQEVRILSTNPLKFIKELHDRWRQKYPAPTRNLYETNEGHRKRHSAPGCIFISYASEDVEIARDIVNHLQGGGCLVWFDKQQLQFGQNWDEGVIHPVIEEKCGLFLSLISKETSTQKESYFFQERRWANERQKKYFASSEDEEVVFYIPMRIDDEEPLIPRKEPCPNRTQGLRCIGGKLNEDIIGRFRELQRSYCKAQKLPLPNGSD